METDPTVLKSFLGTNE